MFSLEPSVSMFSGPKKKEYDVVIIGGGVAGGTAAIYSSRALLSTLVIDASSFGGQAILTTDIENWPGEKSITGEQLAKKVKEHMLHFGTELLENTEVRAVDFDKRLVDIGSSKISYKALIIATGEKPRLLNIPGEKELTGRGVSYCATCDAAFFKDKRVVVVGGGNTALQESLYLTNFASEVFLVHRRDKFRGEKILQKKVMEHPKIKILYNTEVKEIIGENKVQAVKLFNNKDNTYEQMPTDAVFIFIGMIPNSDFVKDKIEVNDYGYIKVDEHMRTNIAGVFAAGDITNGPIKQLITAAASGAIAGISAYEYINNL